MANGVIEKDDAHDNRIGSLQVETQTTSSCREDEDFDFRVLRIEVLHVQCTFLGLRATIETEIFPAHDLEEILHDIHDLRHLEENKDLKET